MRIGQSVAAVAVGIAVWMATGCATRTWYEAPPAMPRAVSPEAYVAIPGDTPVSFVWTPSARAETYDFHVFDQTDRDIGRYYREALDPADVCLGDTCQLTLTLSMPAAEGHAWRVRAVNNAGASTWTRNVFTIAP